MRAATSRKPRLTRAARASSGAEASAPKRDLLDLASLTAAELRGLLDLAARLKAEQKAGIEHPHLRGSTLAMIFEKPSLRTRITFEAGMTQLGGHAIHLASQDIGLGARESVKDVARNLSRWVSLIMIRTFAHSVCVELARESTVPVINGLTDLLHPCQLLADLLTLKERFGELSQLKVAFIGDGFNLAQSWIEAASILRFQLTIASPKGYEPRPEFVAMMRCEKLGTLTPDPVAAVADADAVYTDTWTSMGQEKEAARRRRDFRNFQVNAALMARAKPGAVAMHCLPAHRGEEITDDVLDGPDSVVLDQAENRLHAQKAVMLWLLRPEMLPARSSKA